MPGPGNLTLYLVICIHSTKSQCEKRICIAYLPFAGTMNGTMQSENEGGVLPLPVAYEKVGTLYS